MKLNFFVVGKTKISYLAEAEAEYLKRLRPFFKINYQIISPEKINSRTNFEVIKNREGERLLQNLPAGTLIILDEQGEEFTSPNFARVISRYQENSGILNFIIGGTYGLSKIIKKRADLVWSLGAGTLTHELARVVALEQIYRAAMILSGKPYHY
jgi:23S rRNA (pseudouridine1915-N3)-methyltransferase